MYIRWKTRVGKKWQRGPTFSAYLVRCERVHGKPRQKILAYLGSVGEDKIHSHLNELMRERFWQHAHQALASLALTDQEQATIREALAQKVPPLTEQERASNHILTPRERANVVP